MALQPIVGYAGEADNFSDDGELDILDEDEPKLKHRTVEIMKQSSSTRNSPSPGSGALGNLVAYDAGTDDEDDSSDGETVTSTDVIVDSPASSTASMDSSTAHFDLPDTKQQGSVNRDSTRVSNCKVAKLPPEPEGRCSRSLQEKIERMLHKKYNGKLSLNSHVQRKKDFRNPSIYEKLVSFVGIKETGTNYPKKLFDPDSWTDSSFYDELSKAQKEYHAKKDKEKHKRAQVEFVSVTKKQASADEKPARKTKFDIVKLASEAKSNIVADNTVGLPAKKPKVT